MATIKALSLLFSLFLSLSLSSASAPAPGSADCSTLVISMVDCLSYVSNNSTVKKPEGECCSGLKTVLKSNSECLCEAFKNSAQLGVSLNVSKALTLPAACHVASPPLNNCDVSQGPGAAPASSPVGAMSPSVIKGAPSISTGINEVAPALAPSSNSASGLYASVGFVLALAVGLFSLS